MLALEIQLSEPVPNTESSVMFKDSNYEKKKKNIPMNQ